MAGLTPALRAGTANCPRDLRPVPHPRVPRAGPANNTVQELLSTRCYQS